MSNSCQSCGSLGCCLMNSFANAIDNLFSTAPYCGCGRSGNPVSFTDGFVSGVNAANEIYGLGNGNGGCGCGGNGNGGCGCNNGNGDLSAYTGCGNQGYDPYYARQYALCPSCGNNGCGCGNGNGNCGCGGNF